MRTIKQFISKTNKVYFFMKDKATCRSFYQAAEAEGISFCGTPPTQKETTDIVALAAKWRNMLCRLGRQNVLSQLKERCGAY